MKPGEETPAEATPPPVVFVHIRKTAGTTVRRILYRQYRRHNTRMVRAYFVDPERSLEMLLSLVSSPPPGLRALHGHMLFWPDLPWAPGTKFFAFLRDPVERTISHYCWLRERSAKFETSLEDALVQGLIHDNLQTRVIAGSMPFVATEETLEQALANLDRLTAIGLTERFDESVVLLTRSFGWRPMAYSAANITANRPPRQQFSRETLEIVEKYNSLDLELYRAAKARFEREVAAQPDSFAVDVAALSSANACLAAAPDDARLDWLVPGTDPAGAAKKGGDLRELLVEARASVLLRDAEIERLRARSQQLPARPAAKAQPDPQERRAALEASAGRARRRLENATRKLDALERAGTAPDAHEVEALRGEIARARTRLDAFERRRAKLDLPEAPLLSG